MTSQVVWVDRRGRIAPVRDGARIDGETPQLSPDGRRNALIACPDHPAQACPDLWTYDLARHQLTRLTFGAAAAWPVWTPDGQRVAFSSDLRGPTGAFWIPAEGTEPRAPEPLTDTEDLAIPVAWSEGGDTLVFARRAANLQWDIWALSPGTGIAEARPIVATDFDEVNPALSPDGRWLAYVPPNRESPMCTSCRSPEASESTASRALAVMIRFGAAMDGSCISSRVHEAMNG